MKLLRPSFRTSRHAITVQKGPGTRVARDPYQARLLDNHVLLVRAAEAVNEGPREANHPLPGLELGGPRPVAFHHANSLAPRNPLLIQTARASPSIARFTQPSPQAT